MYGDVTERQEAIFLAIEAGVPPTVARLMQTSFAPDDFGPKSPIEFVEICRSRRDQLANVKADSLPLSARGELFMAIGEYDVILGD
jgi:hypothetical protein